MASNREPKTMRTLYLFTNTVGNGYTGWEHCFALADDGVVLASHLCSSVGFMEGDLISNRPERKEMYEKHFGGPRDEAFIVKCLPPGELPPDSVMAANRALAEKTDGE
jgi:hypothetical protein